MKQAVILTVALALAAGGCCPRQSADCRKTPAVSLAKLAQRPSAFQDKLVAVTGLLRNSGSNYFTDLKLELSDQAGVIAVHPWLPLEAPPPRPGGAAARPAVLSDYLGKSVRLTGCLRKEGEAYSFEVQQAEIIAEVNR